MIDLYSPQDNVELALIKSILDADDIHYYIRNDKFGSMYIGPQIELYNQRTFVVQDEQFERARELLGDFFASLEKTDKTKVKGYTFFDKIRMVVEFLVFGWIMPGRSKRRNVDE